MRYPISFFVLCAVSVVGASFGMKNELWKIEKVTKGSNSCDNIFPILSTLKIYYKKRNHDHRYIPCAMSIPYDSRENTLTLENFDDIYKKIKHFDDCMSCRRENGKIFVYSIPIYLELKNIQQPCKLKVIQFTSMENIKEPEELLELEEVGVYVQGDCIDISTNDQNYRIYKRSNIQAIQKSLLNKVPFSITLQKENELTKIVKVKTFRSQSFIWWTDWKPEFIPYIFAVYFTEVGDFKSIVVNIDEDHKSLSNYRGNQLMYLGISLSVSYCMALLLGYI